MVGFILSTIYHSILIFNNPTKVIRMIKLDNKFSIVKIKLMNVVLNPIIKCWSA